jgi:hypothetical protein
VFCAKSEEDTEKIEDQFFGNAKGWQKKPCDGWSEDARIEEARRERPTLARTEPARMGHPQSTPGPFTADSSQLTVDRREISERISNLGSQIGEQNEG